MDAARAESAGEPAGAAGGVDQERAVDRFAIFEADRPRPAVAADGDGARARPSDGASRERALDEQPLEASPVEVPPVPVRREDERHLVDAVAPPRRSLAVCGEMRVERAGDAERLQQRQRGGGKRLAGLVAAVVAALEDERRDPAPPEGQRGGGGRRAPADDRHRDADQRKRLGFGRLRGRTPPSTGRLLRRAPSAAIRRAAFCFDDFPIVTPRSTCITGGKAPL